MIFKRKTEADGKRRFSPFLWLSGVGAIGVMALGISGTLAQFTASITNTENHVETGGADSFGFSESNVVGGVPEDPACAQASAGASVNCSEINKNGQTGATAAPMAPGDVVNTTVRMENTATGPGALSGTLTLAPAACSQAPPVDPVGPPVVGDLCGTVTVAVACAGVGVPAFDLTARTLTNFNTGTPTPPAPPYVVGVLAPGQFVDCTFTTALPATATDPSLQGIITSQPMTWTFTQV
jgi:hypothetical protein